MKKEDTNRQSYLAQLAQLQRANPSRAYLPTYECFQVSRFFLYLFAI